MTGVYIHCPLLSEADYRTVLETLCPATVRNATIYLHAQTLRPKQLERLMEVQKNFGMDRPIRFRNILQLQSPPTVTRSVRRVLSKNSISVHLQTTPAALPRVKRTVQALTKHSISCKLWVDTDEQAEAYECFRRAGLPLNLTRPRYDSTTADRFSAWLYDPTAQGINTFCDIIAMLTLETHSPNCRYASCLGTTFRVDEQLQVYLCPRHMDSRTHLGALNTPNELLQCDTVMRLLTQAIDKRSRCAESCQSFAHCQGGCLLEGLSDDECRHYAATVARIRQQLLEVYRSGRLDRVNPTVKNAILNALAFGTAFFDPPVSPANQKA